MVLSDRTIKEEISAGRLVFDPYDASLVQPSSVDMRVDGQFRVFHNARYPYIDVKRPMDELTELVETEGDDPFILHPGEFVLGQTLERVTLPDDLVARLEGKALALDTLIPTPHGWTTMAEIDVDHEVFDPEGRPIKVVAATDVLPDRPCFEVVFTDGTVVVADAEHRWEVWTKYERRYGKPPRVLSTREIAGSTLLPNGECRYRIPRAKPVAYAPRDLPIDPYVLGVWIGDGTSTKAEVTTVDQPILLQLQAAGYGVRRASGPIAYRVGGTGHTRDPITGRYERNDSLSSKLRDLGLLGNKRIPDQYMEAGVEQRTSLLEGLMDTDGYVDRWGRCELTTVKQHLADQYCELIASLGHRPVVASKSAMLNGKCCGVKHDVTFTPHERVFRLPRKIARQRLTQRYKHHTRGIREVRPVASVPVRCIEVEGERGAYLISESFISTHNSSLGRLGLVIHSTAGFVDPGFAGNLTLELSNLATLPITIYKGMPIGQISFMRMDGAVENPYGGEAARSKYQGQAEPTASRYYLNFDRSDLD